MYYKYGRFFFMFFFRFTRYNTYVSICKKYRRENWDKRVCVNPTNIASVNLVMGCPNARAGVGIVGKKTLRATKFRPLR